MVYFKPTFSYLILPKLLVDTQAFKQRLPSSTLGKSIHRKTSQSVYSLFSWRAKPGVFFTSLLLSNLFNWPTRCYLHLGICHDVQCIQYAFFHLIIVFCVNWIHNLGVKSVKLYQLQWIHDRNRVMKTWSFFPSRLNINSPVTSFTMPV